MKADHSRMNDDHFDIAHLFLSPILRTRTAASHTRAVRKADSSDWHYSEDQPRNAEHLSQGDAPKFRQATKLRRFGGESSRSLFSNYGAPTRFRGEGPNESQVPFRGRCSIPGFV